MHIIYNTTEKSSINKVKLPEGTTLVQCRNDESQTPMYRFIVSEHGIYSINWNRRKTFRLMKCTYGHNDKIAKFVGWHDTLEYVAKHHHYEDPTRKKL